MKEIIMTFIDALIVIFIGIIEGITEWLPVSSTGHMLLFDEFFTMKQSDAFKEMFFVVIQLGAILAVVVLFWKKMWPFGLKKTEEKSKIILKKDIFMTWVKVVIACIPGAIITILFDDYVEAHFTTPVVIASALIFYGLLFIVVETWNKNRKPKVDELSSLPYRYALIIGLFQVLSIVPGTSRSGATIIGALLIGISRTVAAEFTFFLAVPAMFGLSLIKLVKFGFHFSTVELLTLLLGMVVAFVVSLGVIRFLMNYIKKHDFKVFGYYRIALGILVLIYFLLIK